MPEQRRLWCYGADTQRSVEPVLWHLRHPAIVVTPLPHELWWHVRQAGRGVPFFDVWHASHEAVAVV